MCLDMYLDQRLRVHETNLDKRLVACAQDNTRSLPYFVYFKVCIYNNIRAEAHFPLRFLHRHVLFPVLYFASVCLLFYPLPSYQIRG